MSVPVSRSNIPPSPYGPAQAMMYVTQQPHQAQMAQINERERVRIAMINRQRQQQARSAGINKNGKRPLEPETKQSKQEFGALVPRRLQDSHGERVKFHFAFGETE